MAFNKRAQKFKEQFFAYDYQHDSFDPPLKIVSSGVSRWGPGDSFKFEKKKTLSLNLLTAGNAEYVQNSRKGKIESGEVFLAHKGKNQIFKTGNLGFLHKRTILLEGNGLEGLLQSTGLAEADAIHPASKQRIISLFKNAYHLMRNKPEDLIKKQSSLAFDIILELVQSLVLDYPPSIRSAIEFIKRNLDKKINLDDIAKASDLSIRHCMRLFHRYCGKSPVQFLQELRLSQAKNLLANTSLPVKQIALAVGYDDPFHFSAQFKRRFLKSPKYFREEM